MKSKFISSPPRKRSLNAGFEIRHARRRGVVVITIAQLHSTKLELRFRAGSNPARGVSEIRDDEDL